MKQKTTYQCEYCDKEYDNDSQAKVCEETCKEVHESNQLLIKYNLLFPKRHKKDDRYTKHCVLCGKKLLEIEAVWDGHRNEPGDTTFREPNMCILEGGRYCHNCYVPRYKEMVTILVKHLTHPKIK